MTYYRVSYPGFLQTVVWLFDTREQAEAWVRKMSIGKIATIDLLSTIDHDTKEAKL